MYGGMNESMEMLIGAGIIVVMVAVMFGIVAAVLQFIGLYRLAKREGLGEIAWFLLIPVLSSYVMGRIPERSAHRSLRKHLGTLNAVLFVLALITQVLWVVYIPVYLYTVYLTYKRYSTKHIAMMIVTVLTGFAAYPFMIFAIRNNEVVDYDGTYENGDVFDHYVDETSKSKVSMYTDEEK